MSAGTIYLCYTILPLSVWQAPQFISAVTVFSIPRYIDQGHNPELFTRHQLEQTVEYHQEVQRKVQAYKVSGHLSTATPTSSIPPRPLLALFPGPVLKVRKGPGSTSVKFLSTITCLTNSRGTNQISERNHA